MLPTITPYKYNTIPQNTIFGIAEENLTCQSTEKNLNFDEINALYHLSDSTCLSELTEDDANIVIQYFQKYIPELSNKMNSESLLLLIKKKAIKVENIPIEMQTNDILMSCCQYDEDALAHIAKEKRTRQMCELACSVNIGSLAYTPSEFIDKDFLSKINNFHPSVITYIPNDLIDERIIISCCQNEPKFIRHVDSKRFDKGNIISTVFKTKKHIIMYIDDVFKTKEICELACKEDGLSIKYVPAKYRSFDLYLIACKSNPQAIELIPADMEIEKKRHIYQHACKASEYGLQWVPQEEKTFELCKIARTAFPYSREIKGALPKHLTEIEKNELSSLFKRKDASSPKNNENYHLSSYNELLKCLAQDNSPGGLNEKRAISLIIDPFTPITFIPKHVQYRLLTCSHVSADEKKKLIDFINHSEKNLAVTKKRITTDESPSQFSVDNELLYDLVSTAHEFDFQPPNFQIGSYLVDCIKNESNIFQKRTMPEYLKNGSCSIRGGRTLLISSDKTSELLHIKFQRKNEPLEELIREGNIYKIVHNNGILKNKFRSEIPKFVEFARVKVNEVDIQNLSSFDDKLEFEKENNETYINVLVYKATPEYTKYAHILNDDVNIPEEGILKACSDIGLLASMGIVLDSILPAFHDPESKRRWVAFFSVFCSNRGFVHPGTFRAWNTSATEKCDIGYTGIRDIGDHEIFGKIGTCLSQRNTSEPMFPDRVNQRIGFCNTVTEALIAAILIRSRLYQQTDAYHYRNPESINSTAQFINNIGNAFCNSFYNTSSSMAFKHLLGMNSDEYDEWLQRTALEIVYWTAQQPTFDELVARDDIQGDCYLSHVKNNHTLHQDIYPNTKDMDIYKCHFNPEKQLNLGKNNSTFPLLSLLRGLTLMSVNLLTRQG